MKTSPAPTNLVMCAEANPTVATRNERKVRMMIQNSAPEVWQDAVILVHMLLTMPGMMQSSWAKLFTQGPLGKPPGAGGPVETVPVTQAHMPIVNPLDPVGTDVMTGGTLPLAVKVGTPVFVSFSPMPA